MDSYAYSVPRKIAALLFCLAGALGAQSVQPLVPPPQIIEVQPADIVDRLSFVQDWRKLSTPLYEVTGDTPFPGQVLYTKKLVFHPGGYLELQASLRGSDNTLSPTSNSTNEIYIVANSIVIESAPTHAKNTDANKPSQRDGAGITWVYESLNRTAPDVGVGSSGSVGGGPSAAGSPGADGVLGNPGYPGRRGPTLYLIFGEISGGPLSILLTGSPGSPGGAGQSGGNGGPGQIGRSAVFNVFSCASAAGAGGDGGAAGNGGKGGTGGQGGSGGNLLIASSANSMSELKARLNVVANQLNGPAGNSITAYLGGGPGGKGGPGGSPGTPGVGGPGGAGNGTCPGGGPGQTGKPGKAGPVGDKGQDGQPGTAALVSLPDNLLELLGITHNDPIQ